MLVALVSLALADQIARHVGLSAAAGVLCLTSLASLVVCVRLGWRHALLGLVLLALLTVPAVLSQREPFTATVLMALTAFALGLSARWQWHKLYWLMLVSICLLITHSPFASPPSASELTRFATAVFLSGGFTILLQMVVVPPQGASPAESLLVVAHSWRRSTAYGLLLASTAIVSTPIAVQERWGITGLWLILTPFLVLRPFVRDAWMAALHRSFGTVAGVLLLVLLAVLLPKDLPLQIPAIVGGVITAMIATRRGHPAVMLMALTVTIVLFNSNHADLLLMADRRLQACSLGVVLALLVMAIAQPIERRFQGSRPAEAP